ncbi:PD-(D/E)XK nuclease-like domain-containing protein [Flavobacteriaceae bacterium]|nr:PD-(D/E)XK nuclease-like domain-containing protein [Flavobacteriaceae bacterium]|tara:strand:+ start:9356 stop:10099 length:744 start_codon:yes stop_codon:yes gene_type:complete
MNKKDILKSLEDDSKYYGDFGKQYLSNSDIRNLLKNPTQFRQKNEFTKPMLEGRYFHTKILEPHKIKDFQEVDASSRATKKYKEELADSKEEMLLLKKEREHLDFLCTKMTSNMEMFDLIYEDGNEFEVPGIDKIMNLDWKGKADIINNNSNLIIDIKTSGDIDKFMYSAKTYNYDSQAYIYQRLFGKPLIFLVIDKTTARLGIFECSPSFIQGGQEKVEQAVDVYHKFFSDEKTEDINSYIHRQTL